MQLGVKIKLILMMLIYHYNTSLNLFQNKDIKY